ncbi:RAMP superfamily CRISPR-associated protein [Bacteroides sp. OttesenSCG-928-E20]|nr:RAMP superfamily CRISPR-associated protein [Bacteroides sp. OttesenSCG-928-N06]MDL2299162.1 RAMP superfamily CRISPR-associated protein [Bacteroides sp. OttesenSCG-928-E20]MDL2304649.1 RAMP superfamily CRISPR-associated protein [Bacteroides sp. OttesenSCG-928-D19]
MAEEKINTPFIYRYLANVVLEAATPLSVGSGQKSIMTDATVMADANGLPYIPGSTLSGILRHAQNAETANEVFGYQNHQKPKESKGSEIIISDARIIGPEGEVLDGLLPAVEGEFYRHFQNLPIRQRVRIGAKGSTEKGGKFDRQVVYKGTRFLFEIEMVAKDRCENTFNEILNELYDKTFRIGGNTRTGLGEVKVVACSTLELNLTNADDLKKYITHTSKLSVNKDGFRTFVPKASAKGEWVNYELNLEAESFFLFSSGFGNERADNTAVTETVIEWRQGKPEFKQNNILIPASSVKGALAHRVAYYYNQSTGYFATKEHVADKNRENLAVTALFGRAKDEEQTRGNVLFSDVIEVNPNGWQKKIFNHVSIDQFTGGSVDAALFSEEAVWKEGTGFVLKLWVNKKALEDKDIETAFDKALLDVCTGMLSLGGATNKGYGAFIGKLTKDGKELTA